mgnify:CR=1 FL=1
MSLDWLAGQLNALNIENEDDKLIKDFYIDYPAVIYADYEYEKFIVIIVNEQYYEEIEIERNWRYVAKINFKLYYRDDLYQTEMFFLEEPTFLPWPNEFAENISIYSIQCQGTILKTGVIEMPDYKHILCHYNYGKITFFEDPHDYSIKSSILLIHR